MTFFWPFMTFTLLSGLTAISNDYYEAATIDGADVMTKLTRITLPLLKGVIRTTITFWSINATTFFLWTKMFSPINTEDTTIVPVVYLYIFGEMSVQSLFIFKLSYLSFAFRLFTLS